MVKLNIKQIVFHDKHFTENVPEKLRRTVLQMKQKTTTNHFASVVKFVKITTNFLSNVVKLGIKYYEAIFT